MPAYCCSQPDAHGPQQVFVYSLEENETLLHRDEGYTFVMTRGIGGSVLTREAAVDLIDQTAFILRLDGTDLSPDKEMGVEELGANGWHVVQPYTVNELSLGTYVLYGETELKLEGGTDSNTVNLEIVTHLR